MITRRGFLKLFGKVAAAVVVTPVVALTAKLDEEPHSIAFTVSGLNETDKVSTYIPDNIYQNIANKYEKALAQSMMETNYW